MKESRVERHVLLGSFLLKRGYYEANRFFHRELILNNFASLCGRKVCRGNWSGYCVRNLRPKHTRMFRLVAMMRDARTVPSAVQPFTRMDATGSFEVPSQMELRLFQALSTVGLGGVIYIYIFIYIYFFLGGGVLCKRLVVLVNWDCSPAPDERDDDIWCGNLENGDGDGERRFTILVDIQWHNYNIRFCPSISIRLAFRWWFAPASRLRTFAVV